MSFLKKYIDYCKKRIDADERYHTFLYLQALGHAIGKKSVCNMIPNEEHHNFYVLLIGDSYYGRKGVSQDLSSILYPQDHILPNEFSPEQFITNMSTSPKSILMLGEFSKILKMCKSGKGYLAPIIEIWNDLYRYKRRYYIRDTKTSGKIVIDNPYLSINATCTEEVLKKYLEIEMLSGGFFGRFILVQGLTVKQPRKPLPPGIKDEENTFIELFSELNKYFSDNDVKFKFNDDAFKRLNEIEDELYKETKITSIAGRYGQSMIAIADLLSFDKILNNSINSYNSNNSDHSDNSKKIKPLDGSPITIFTTITNFPKIIEVTEQQVNQAYDIIKPSIDYVRELKDWCESEPYVAKLREYMDKNKHSTRTKFMQLSNVDLEHAKKAQETLGDEGTKELIIVTVRPKGKKPTVCYCWKKYITKEKCKKCNIKNFCEHYKEV